MNKTLHQKLSDKAIYIDQVTDLNFHSLTGDSFHLEQKLKDGLQKELLSPRPEAVSRLLELSRSL